MKKKTILYQYNTLDALLFGMYDGDLDVNQLLEYGDFGIGTINAVDGELIVLDNTLYLAKEDDTVEILNGVEQLTPYAAITKFTSKNIVEVKEQLDYENLKAKIINNLAGKYMFSAIKVTGEFDLVKYRIHPKEEKPYQRMVNSKQPEYQITPVNGTIVGYYTPELFKGVAEAGFHLHFLNEAKNKGGHVLDVKTKNVKIEIMPIDQLIQDFPLALPEFNAIERSPEILEQDMKNLFETNED